jgi:hypothetical protein
MTLQDLDRSLRPAARLHARAMALLPLGALLVLPLSSAAQPPSPVAPSGASATAPDPPDQERHRSEALKRASAAIRANRPLEALAAWREAYAIRPDFRIACNIGMAERADGSQRAAVVFLTECLQGAPSSPTEDEKRRSVTYDNSLQSTGISGDSII